MDDAKKAYQKLLKKTDELVKSQFIVQFGNPSLNERNYPVLSFCSFAKIDAQMTTDYEKYADYPHIGIDSIEKDTGRLFGYRSVAEDHVKSGKYILVEGWEGLMAAQECLPTNKEKDAFAADYRVVNNAWNALSPDACLLPYKYDYQWLSRVYESVKPTDGRGGLIWATLGSKTIELVHENITVGDADDSLEILSLDADLIDDFIDKQKDLKKETKKVEINLIAKILAHGHDPKFVKLGEKLESLREKHEQGLLTSIEFLKLLLELAKEAAKAEKEVVPVQEIDKGKAALTELFNGVKKQNTPIIVERIVSDIDSIVKIVRFDGWQNTTAGKQEVKKVLRSVVWVKYKIKDKDVFDKAYSYIEQYY